MLKALKTLCFQGFFCREIFVQIYQKSVKCLAGLMN